MSASTRTKLYVYPDAQHLPLFLKGKEYFDKVPFSEKGINDHCEITSADKTEYYYMGQVSCGTRMPNKGEFEYFEGNESRHIIDFEGDWFQKSVPGWLRKSLISVSGVKSEYEGMNVFARPAFSSLLLDIINNNRKVKYTFEPNRGFCFKGLPDPRGIRFKMAEACASADIKSNIEFNQAWQGKAHTNSKAVTEYCRVILQNTFSLCPSGTGVDSVRFFETCFFSRIPVVISRSFTMGHEFNKTKPFYFQIDPYISIEDMVQKLSEVERTPIDQLKEMSSNSKDFFESNIRSYFEDPTLRFIEWLKKNEG